MKYKFSILFFLGVLVVYSLSNSCKKDTQGSIENLLANGQWQLASVQVTYFVGDTLKRSDTLNNNCNLVQLFKFNIDKSCTYTNFDCVQQPPASGHWSLSSNKILLYADIVCQDTTAAKSSKPFANSQIVNLGQYSLILETGDLATYYPPNKKRRIVRYAFVRQKI